LGAKKIKPVKKAPAKLAPAQSAYAEKFSRLAEKNSSLIIGIGAAVLFAIISIWGLRAYDAHQENKARSAYPKIASKLPAEGKATRDDWQKAIPDLQKFVSEHGGTQAALLARIDLAKAFFETGNHEESIKTCLEAMKAVPQGHALRSLVQYQLVHAYQAAGKTEEAAGIWAQLKESENTAFRREAEWNIGRTHAAKKDFAKAAEAYQKAAETPGNYPAPAVLDQDLSRAKQEAGIVEKQPK